MAINIHSLNNIYMITTYVLFLNHETDELGVATYSAYKQNIEPLGGEYLLESTDVNYLCDLADTTKVFCTSLPLEIAEQFD
jgi:hypothetical protein